MNNELYTPPTAEEIRSAIEDWMDERTPDDPGEISLAKIWLRLNRENVKICPECDGKCGEPCAITAEQHWAALCNPRKRPSGECPWPSAAPSNTRGEPDGGSPKA